MTGVTAYMLDPRIPVCLRGPSSFQGRLPFVLVWAAPRPWVACVMAFNAIVLYVPTHLILRRAFRAPSRSSLCRAGGMPSGYRACGRTGESSGRGGYWPPTQGVSLGQSLMRSALITG